MIFSGPLLRLENRSSCIDQRMLITSVSTIVFLLNALILVNVPNHSFISTQPSLSLMTAILFFSLSQFFQMSDNIILNFLLLKVYVLYLRIRPFSSKRCLSIGVPWRGTYNSNCISHQNATPRKVVCHSKIFGVGICSNMYMHCSPPICLTAIIEYLCRVLVHRLLTFQM